MTKYRPGDVVLIPYPFSDLSGVKQRPALILVSIESQNEAVCLMLTSQRKGGSYEYVVKKWKESGLYSPTVARISRLFTVDHKIIITKIGRLNNEEFLEILAKVQNMLNYQRLNTSEGQEKCCR